MFLKKLKAMRRSAQKAISKVIVLTAVSNYNTLSNLRSFAGVTVLQKPVDPEDLIKFVK